MQGHLLSRLGPVLLLLCSAAVAQLPSDFNLRANYVGFDTGSASLPDMGLFDDPANNAIGVACIDAPAAKDLDKLALPDLQQRLEKLQHGNALRIVDGRCSLTFPVLVGKRRQDLQTVVDEAAARLAPRVLVMKQRLQAAVPDRPEMVFHLLWSRVMDDSWDSAWKAAFKSDGPTDAVWVIYPHQTYDAGTNFSSVPGYGSYALTWSDATRPQLRDTTAAIVDAFRIGWNKGVSPADAARLQKYGLMTADAKARVFTFHVGDPTDKLVEELRAEYGTLAGRAYDYPALAQRFGIPPETMFLILLHETAYALFANLHRAGQLDFPAILSSGGDAHDTVRLISLRLDKPPGPSEDAMYLFVKTGWRGNADTAAAFRHVVELDPNNLKAWLYLGFSLYEIKDYRGAITAFDQLTEHAGDDLRMRDWGRVWSGHMYDLLGEREHALALYRVVAASDDKQTMMFGQYGIGQITAAEWARQRLATPFVRR
jgi:hypothetical protein